MDLYSRYVLPHLIHLACSGQQNMLQRQRLVPQARGDVLEVGIGTGLNLQLYDRDHVTKVWGLDPSPEITRIAAAAAAAVPFDVEFVLAGSEEIPLDGDRFDTILMTYALCSIADAGSALREMARVLKPGGQLLFCEHGAAPDAGVRRWQNRVDPIWSRVGGGCHLNRDIPDLIGQGGFQITEMDAAYIPGCRPASFNYRGTAAAC